MVASQLMLPANRAFNSNGFSEPGAVAKLYDTGTSTPATFYADESLTIPLGTSITANAAGRFATPAYQNADTPFRLVIEDADGNELDDIDPYYFGTVYGSTIPPVASRTALAAINGAANQMRYLTEARREGPFVFSTADLSAKVSADTLQGIYVAPDSDPTGASGAWVRKDDGEFRPEHYGAVGDGLADDTAAFNAMIAAMPSYGGKISLSRAYYRITSRVVVGKSVSIIGAGNGTRSRVYGEAEIVNGWESYTGSVIVCDSDVAGLLFPLHTDVEDTADVIANRGATGSNPTYWEFPGADGANMVGVTLYSKGGTSTAAHGVEIRARVHLRNIRVVGFGGDGFKITASADAALAGSAYGNASESTLTSCQAISNRGDGFRVIGRDTNVIRFDSCEALTNG